MQRGNSHSALVTNKSGRVTEHARRDRARPSEHLIFLLGNSFFSFYEAAIANHSGGSSLEFVLYFDDVPPKLADVAVGSNATVGRCPRYFRFTPKTDIRREGHHGPCGGFRDGRL